jgi:DNA-binding CsgD family transcriptional regulator
MLSAMRLVQETASKIPDEFFRDFLAVQSLHLEGHYLGLQGRLAAGLALEERACAAATATKNKPGPVGAWPERWHEFLLTRSGDDDSSDANNAGSPHLSHVTSRVGLANFTTNCCGWQSLDLNDPVRAREKHESICDARGRFITPFLLNDLLLCGDVERLRELAEAGSSMLSTNNPDTIGAASTLLAYAEGRWSEYRSGYEIRGRKWREGRSAGVTMTFDRSLLRGARALYDVALAEELAQSGLAIAIRSQAVKYEFIFRAESALLAAEYKDLANAESHLARCNEILAEGEDWRGVRGRLALAEAVVAAGRGRHDQADAEFTLALEVFRSMSLPWDEAETFELWARFGRRFHRGAGRRAFIADKLGEARAVYVHIGAGQPWLDRLEAEAGRLAAEGSHVKSEPLPDGLTAREGEVLRLVAMGRSSREIGADLVLSVRTVERHVANIYLKTGTHGRAQVTSYAVARGLASAEV